ncbi:MAG: MBG domain-containing protein, partial [bacterium]
MKNLKLLFLAVLLLGANAASVLAESATVTISNLEATFNGSPQGVVVDTIPAGLTVEVKYNDSTEIPTNAGSYSVTATTTDPNYEGSASANFEIKKAEIHLVIGNLQQTFTGRYLPVTIALAEGQSLPLNLIPLNLNVSYALQTNGGTQGTVGYTRSEGNTYFETTNQQGLPDSQTQSPPERTYAGFHSVQVSCDDGNFACLAVTFPKRYQVITGSFTWEGAKADAEARGGHLATITSEAEKNNMVAELGGPDAISSWAYWIGAKHDSGHWKWITEESWSYTDWGGSEGQGGRWEWRWWQPEPYGVFMGMAQVAGYEHMRLHWGDIYYGDQSYILEFEEETVTRGTPTLTLIVAKGKIGDFLRVSQQAFDYCDPYGSNWPTLESGVEVNAEYAEINQLFAWVSGFGWGPEYTLSGGGPNGWNSARLTPPPNNPYNPNNDFPNLQATLRPNGNPIDIDWNPFAGARNGYPYSFEISTLDPNLEGTITVPLGIRQLPFGVQVGDYYGGYGEPQSKEFDGNFTPVSIRQSYGSLYPQRLDVSCNWRNWVGDFNPEYGNYQVSYTQSWQENSLGVWSVTYSPSEGAQPILPPGTWQIDVWPGGRQDQLNFDGGGSGFVNISKKPIAFRIGQPFSENGTGVDDPSGLTGELPVIQQFEGTAGIPVTLSGVVLYDQYGRSISAGTNPPNIRVVYRNNASGAEAVVEYQVSSIPAYNNSGIAMVADLAYTPVGSQPLTPGEYSVRAELLNPEQNSMTNFGDGGNFFDYFYISNFSTQLANLKVAIVDITSPVITLEGVDPLEIFKNGAYSDPGASVTDDVDASRTITGSGEVNTAVVGNYTVTYTAQDAAGNQAAPLTRTVSVILDPAGDEDGDRLTNAQELALGTNPENSDSDGDGYTDLVEVEGGTDPLGTNPIPEAMVNVRGGALPQGSELAGQSVGRFEIGKYEVTWAEWKAVRYWAVAHGYTDLADIGAGAGQTHPVSQVNWYDVVKWCNAKSEWEGLDPVYQNGEGTTYKTGQFAPMVNASANGYRLPSEKEWEWAARGGIFSNGYVFSGGNDLNEVAWWLNNSNSTNNVVGRKIPNELGIFDMTGNVREMTWSNIRGGDWTIWN